MINKRIAVLTVWHATQGIKKNNWYCNTIETVRHLNIIFIYGEIN